MLLDSTAKCRDQRVQFAIAQPKRHLAVPHTIVAKGRLASIEIGRKVGEEGAHEGREVPKVVLCGCRVEIVSTKRDGLRDQAVGPLHAATHLSFVDDFDQATIGQLVEMPVERCLRDIPEALLDLQRRQRRTAERLDDPEPNRMKKQVARLHHRRIDHSDGDYVATGLHDNIDDARAALDALRARPEVDWTQVFVIGHSEGALIAADLASDAELAGAVLLAGTAHDGRHVLRWQARQIAPTLPKPVRWLMKLLRQDLEETQSKRLARIAASTEDVIRIQFVKLNAKWFREFMAYHPANALRRAETPILAITGSKDIQVDSADIDVMRRVVPTPFVGHVVDDVTHLLRGHDPL